MKPLLLVGALAAITSIDLANVFAQTGSAEHNRPTQTAQCGFVRNRAWFDTCTCGEVADELLPFVQASASPIVILIDGYANTNEPAGIERSRAENAWLYLVNEKGVDRSRIALRWTRQRHSGVGKYVLGMRITLLRAGDALPPIDNVSIAQLPSK